VVDDKKNQPDYVCKSAREMLTDIQIVRDVSAGTRHLRDCARANLYLPPEPKEQPEAYAIRKSRALLFNAYERAKNTLVGMVFSGEPELAPDVPEVMRGIEAAEGQAKIEGQLEDCDLAGTHLFVFAKEFLTDAFEGHAFLYVDMPPALPSGSTLADERNQDRRPYLVKYKADQAVNWRLDSRGKLRQITFEECTTEDDGEYGEIEVKKYRVLRPGSWQLWKKVKDDAGKESVILESEGSTSPVKDIPVSICYTKKKKPLVSMPVMLDLAMTNLTHYAESSDYRIYLHIASRPLLWFKGRDKNKKVEAVGPYTIFDVSDTGQVAFAETTGAALGAARQDLKDLEDQMAMLGLSMLAEKVPNKTATEVSGDQTREMSELASAARSLKDALEQALKYWAQYLGLPSGGQVKIGVDDDDLTVTPQEIQAFDAMAGRVFSTETVREVIVNARRRVFPENYDKEEEKKRLEKESADAAASQELLGASFGRGFNAGGLPQ
jgi:hypothetical protein